MMLYANGGDCWRLLGSKAHVNGALLTVNCLCMGTGAVADKVDMSKLLWKRASLIGSTLRSRSTEFKARLVSSLTEEFNAELKQGLIKPPVDKVCWCMLELLWLGVHSCFACILQVRLPNNLAEASTISIHRTRRITKYCILVCRYLAGRALRMRTGEWRPARTLGRSC